jgi:hypothetical protein
MKIAGDPTQFLELFSLLGSEKDMFWPIAVAGNQKVSGKALSPRQETIKLEMP